MKRSSLNFFTLAVVLGVVLAGALPAMAQKQVQDSWALEKTWTNNYALSSTEWVGYGMAIDSSNSVYVVDGERVVVYGLQGVMLQTWSVPGARDIALYSPSNLVLVTTATATNQVKVFDLQGTLIRQWGGSGTGPGQFGFLSTAYPTFAWITATKIGILYVADEFNHRIQRFDLEGNYLGQWGTNGLLSGQFRQPVDIASGIDENLSVADWDNSRIQQFTPTGTFLREYTFTGNQLPKIVCTAPDGVLFAGTYQGDLRLLSPQLEYITSFSFGTLAPNSRIHGAAFSPDGQRLAILADKEIRVFRRIYRTFGLKPPNAIPLPSVWNTAQRSETQLVDADFSVLDPDNTTVHVGAIAFVDGRQDLLAAIPMKTFTNGTDITSWTNVTTGVTHHLIWDAGADWSSQYGNLKINILANDGRDLLLSHFITVPTNATYSAPLTISRSPVGHADFLGVWTWLLASRHPNVNLLTGSVYAVGAAYGVTNNTLLAYTQSASGQYNTLTTADGRTFLYSLISSNLASSTYSNMVVREATTNEIYRAAMGTTHTNMAVVTRWDPAVQINGLPVKVNEYGFDTGLIGNGGTLPSTNWWIVMEPK